MNLNTMPMHKMQARDIQHFCTVCGKEFYGQGNAKRCSDACREEHNRIKELDRYHQTKAARKAKEIPVGQYKEHGSVPLAPYLDDKQINDFFESVFQFRTTEDRGHTAAARIAACHHDKSRRTCAKCGRAYCDLCKSDVHPTCPKGIPR